MSEINESAWEKQNRNDDESNDSERETDEFKGYYDTKSVVSATKGLFDVFPEAEDEIEDLVDIANETNKPLRDVCIAKYCGNEKFSKDDEAAFRTYKQKNPGTTRQSYMEILRAKREWSW